MLLQSSPSHLLRQGQGSFTYGRKGLTGAPVQGVYIARVSRFGRANQRDWPVGRENVVRDGRWIRSRAVLRELDRVVDDRFDSGLDLFFQRACEDFLLLQILLEALDRVLFQPLLAQLFGHVVGF